jgi:hypothetical protein
MVRCVVDMLWYEGYCGGTRVLCPDIVSDGCGVLGWYRGRLVAMGLACEPGVYYVAKLHACSLSYLKRTAACRSYGVAL